MKSDSSRKMRWMSFSAYCRGGEEGQVLKDVRHAGDRGSESREYNHGDNKDGCSYDGVLQGLCEG